METLRSGGWSRNVQGVLRALLLVAILLDGVWLVGAQVAPDAVAQAACALRPICYVAWPFFHDEWFEYASTQCLSYPTDASVSLIFFMVKTSLATCGFAILFVETLRLHRQGNDDGLPAPYGALTKKQICLKDIQSQAPLTIISVPLGVGYWLSRTSGPPENFSTSILSVPIDDCGILGGGIALFAVLGFVLSVIRFIKLSFSDT